MTKTIVGYFATTPESCERVWQEFLRVVAVAEENNSDITTDNLGDFLKSHVMLDTIQDMDYLGMVINEAMRFMPPVTYSSPASLS